jgi:hypothetical protein
MRRLTPIIRLVVVLGVENGNEKRRRVRGNLAKKENGQLPNEKREESATEMGLRRGKKISLKVVAKRAL